MPAQSSFFLVAKCRRISSELERQGKDGEKTGIMKASMNYSREVFLVVRLEAKLLPQDAPGLHKVDTWDFSMLIQADTKLLGRGIESLDSLGEISILLEFLQAPRDKYQHRFDHLDHFMVVVPDDSGYVQDGELL